MDMNISSSVAQIIQLSVAPVFLLAGIGAFLGVMAGRLARIVDRTREIDNISRKDKSQLKELKILRQRAKAINASISLCTTAAILVCLVIIVLFVLHFLNLHAPLFIGSLFVITMADLMIGLALFQVEVYLAIKWLQITSKTD